ncbi:MAG: class I SAM-dependent methyltransferase [Acidiferrobacteraceae bacterium]|jgi:SAM-dependent methyltransferase
MSKSNKQNRKTPSSSRAQSADIHDLYQQSVQAPEADIEFFTETYEQLRGKKPLTMREDFCGTALLSVEWCQSDPERLAFGIDLSEETLDWGREHNIIPAGESVAQRITLRHGNVLDPVEEKVDITCALNFSYCIFKTRDLLRQYFENARAGLAPDGILVLDLFGGTETIDILEEERDVDDADFTYVWDQDRYNPITNEILCYIHFNFPDGSKLERAFTYDWRLWTIPEVREILTEAGFSKVHVYWEEFEESDDEDDDELEGTGRYQDVEEVENQESWVIYIVAER